MPTATTTVRVTLSTFDKHGMRDVYREARSAVPIGEFDGVTPKDYAPSGGTPLRDATARFIGSLREARKASPDDVLIGLLLDESGSMIGNRQAVIEGTNEFVNGMRDVEKIDEAAKGTVLAVIFTDGHENASIEVSPEQLRDMVSDAEKDGFTFIYLGANQDAWSTGASYGMSGSASGQMVNFTSSPTGTRSAMSNVSKRAGSYLNYKADFDAEYGAKATTSITEDGIESTDNTAAPDPSQIPTGYRTSGKLWTPGAEDPKPGDEIPAPTNPDSDAPKPHPYSSDVADALRKARETTGKGE